MSDEILAEIRDILKDLKGTEKVNLDDIYRELREIKVRLIEAGK